MIVTENNLLDIELSINRLVEQKELLVFQKREIELKNTVLNNQVRTGGRMHDVKYKQICDKQSALRKDILEVERAISGISMEIMKKGTLKEQLRIEFKKQQPSDMKAMLIELRDHYIQFASDKTRVASMRAMGAEFAGKVEQILKQL